MTTKVELFDANSLPFGDLSNNAIIPFYKDNKLWKTVTHYVYANLLSGTNKSLLMNAPLKDIHKQYESYRNKTITNLTKNILENGIRTMLSQNSEFRDMLLSTGNKRLIYVTNKTILNQETPLLGVDLEGNGSNALGKIYEMIRNEEQIKQREKKDVAKNITKDNEIVKIILLTKILQAEMLSKFNDLGELSTNTFDSLYDKYQYDIEAITHLTKVLLEQYHSGRLANIELIDEIIDDPDNIVFYVRNRYKDQFKLKLFYARRHALIEHFLKEELKKRHPSEFENNLIALDKEYNAQMDEIMKKGNDFAKMFFDNIIKLYDDNVVPVPEKITNEFTTNIDTEISKNIKDDSLTSDQIDSDPSISKTSDTNENKIDNESGSGVDSNVLSKSIENVVPTNTPIDSVNTSQNNVFELNALQKIANNDVTQLQYTDKSNTLELAHIETLEYIMFTDSPGQFSLLSPYAAIRFSDGFQYPNLISYYYVKLLYSFGNMVHIKSNVICIPGGGLTGPRKLTLSMKKAHRFIMIPECQNINVECDQFDMKNYITDFSGMSDMVQELENRNKVILLREALETKFENDYNLQVLLTQNPTKQIDFLYAESSLPKFRYDSVIGIGPDSRGLNYTGRILGELRKKYIEKTAVNDALDKDVALLSNLFQNDAQLIEWFYTRSYDLVNTILLVFLSTKHVPNTTIHVPKNTIATDSTTIKGYEIDGEFVKKVITYMYRSCNVSFDEFVELDVPEEYFLKINDVFEQKIRMYTDLTDSKIPVSLSSVAILEIYKYSSWLSYRLLQESSRNKQKDNVKLFLTNIVLNMTTNDQKCPLLISSIDKTMRNIDTCIVSAMLNVLKSLILVYGTNVDMMLINSIVNIIYGKPINIVEKEHSDVFSQILTKYPKLYQYIQKSNTPTQVEQYIQKLDLIYDYLEIQSSESYDITQNQNQQVRNRINFFSSIPTKHPSSMVVTNLDDSDSSSDSSIDSEDSKLLQQMKIYADLGPIDLAKSNKTTSKLIPAGRGMPPRPTNTPFQPNDTDIDIQYNKYRSGVIGTVAEQRLMKELDEEFGSSISQDDIVSDINFSDMYSQGIDSQIGSQSSGGWEYDNDGFNE